MNYDKYNLLARVLKQNNNETKKIKLCKDI